MNLNKSSIIQNFRKGKLTSTSQKQVYSLFALYYDEIMKDVDYQSWVDYIIDTIEKYDLPCQDILDIACGTGNVLVPLIKKGYNVDGLDLSDNMLKIAREKCKTKALSSTFYQQDMRQLNLPHQYDIIYSLHDSINYIVTYNDLVNCFVSVRKNLKKNGAFFFDGSTERNILKNFDGREFFYSFQDVHFIWDNKYDKRSREILSTLSFLFLPDGVSYSEKHYQRVHSAADLKRALIHAGFKDIHVFDGFTFRKVKRWSYAIHILARG